jgi:TolA-binding protein
MEEYDLANCELTSYLGGACSPEHFEEAVDLKYKIAEAFRCGARRRPYCSRKFPKLLDGSDLAVEIYDEIISTVPCQEIAALSLYSKGCLLTQQFDYRCAIEAFMGLIRRFPKHELAPDAYVAILGVYRCQAFYEINNPDILDLAELTYVHFYEDYPNDDRLADAADTVMAIREQYADGLYRTGQFFERVCKAPSAALYYVSAIQRFPDTQVADCARRRLCAIQRKHPCVSIPDGIL